MKNKGHSLVMSMLLLAGAALADTHYVVKDNLGAGSPFTNWTTAASNIQQAIDDTNCVASDTVMVASGVYNTGGQAVGTFTNRVAVTKAITVRAFSTNWADTVIEGDPDPNTLTNGPAAIRGVFLTNGTTLIGFTITKGFTADDDGQISGYGGGILCSGASSVVSNCLVVSNYARRGGGFSGTGINMYNCFIANNVARFTSGANGIGGGGYNTAMLRNCVFSNNYARNSAGGVQSPVKVINCQFLYNRTETGGGISGSEDTTVISNCVVMYNNASAGGGGVYRVKSIFNSLIANNSAGVNGGGGVMAFAANRSIVNCTIVSNYSSALIGGVGGPLSYLTNCIVYFNRTGGGITNISPNATSYYCCTFPMPAYGDGNITNDPAFANVSGGDYRLTPDSPCINKGTNQGWMSGTYDIDGHRRIIEGTVDIGAYEFLRRGAIFTLR